MESRSILPTTLIDGPIFGTAMWNICSSCCAGASSGFTAGSSSALTSFTGSGAGSSFAGSVLGSSCFAGMSSICSVSLTPADVSAFASSWAGTTGIASSSFAGAGSGMAVSTASTAVSAWTGVCASTVSVFSVLPASLGRIGDTGLPFLSRSIFPTNTGRLILVRPSSVVAGSSFAGSLTALARLL